jgi:hypothetical protein
VIASSQTPHYAKTPDRIAFVHDADTEPPASLTEPVTPAEAERRQFWELSPPPERLAMIAGGVAAVVAGGAVGYWLGRRSAPPAPRKIGRAAATFESALELAPVAMNLLSNPLIRTLAVRMLVRQIKNRIPS